MGQKIVFGGKEGSVSALNKADIVVVPVPYDKTSTWIKGADKGPFSILEASRALEFYDIETDSDISREFGIFTSGPVLSDSSPEAMTKDVGSSVCGYIKKDKFLVVLGGEHSVSIGAVRAFDDHISDISVLQLDAHADLRDEYEGSRYNHACVMARVNEICPFVQVGIRSMSAEEKKYIGKNSVFFAKDIAGGSGWEDEVIAKLTNNVYVTIDLDVFDPSVLPGTGTPEPGGLSWYDIMGLLWKLSLKKNIVGFDCVELCPITGSKVSDFTAAKLVYGFLSYIFKNKTGDN